MQVCIGHISKNYSFQAIVYLVQQWLPTNDRTKNPVVVQSTRMDVSALFFQRNKTT